MGDELLECLFGVGSEGGVVCKEHLPDYDFAHLHLCSKVGQVEEEPITPSVEGDAIFRLLKGIVHLQGEEHAKECQGQNMILLQPAFDLKGVQGWWVGGHPILCRRVKRPVWFCRA